MALVPVNNKCLNFVQDLLKQLMNIHFFFGESLITEKDLEETPETEMDNINTIQ